MTGHLYLATPAANWKRKRPIAGRLISAGQTRRKTLSRLFCCTTMPAFYGNWGASPRRPTMRNVRPRRRNGPVSRFLLPRRICSGLGFTAIGTDFARADWLLADIEPRMRHLLPPEHYAFASLASDKGLLALAEGNPSRALQFANQAIAIDEASIARGGPCAAYLPILLVRRSAAELALDKRDAAAADAGKALNLCSPQRRREHHRATWGAPSWRVGVPCRL